jgi:hypothetical protein
LSFAPIDEVQRFVGDYFGCKVRKVNPRDLPEPDASTTRKAVLRADKTSSDQAKPIAMNLGGSIEMLPNAVSSESPA